MLPYATDLIIDFAKPVQDYPLALYDIAMHVCGCLFTLLCFRICWSKTRGLKKMMEICSEFYVGKIDTISPMVN